MKSDFTLAFNEIVEKRALPREVVLEALAQALVSAYRRDTNISSNQHVEAIIDPTGGSQILLEKEVTETVENEQTEVALEVAREYHPGAARRHSDGPVRPAGRLGRSPRRRPSRSFCSAFTKLSAVAVRRICRREGDL